jgi:hypothetical protein
MTTTDTGTGSSAEDNAHAVARALIESMEDSGVIDVIVETDDEEGRPQLIVTLSVDQTKSLIALIDKGKR